MINQWWPLKTKGTKIGGKEIFGQEGTKRDDLRGKENADVNHGQGER